MKTAIYIEDGITQLVLTPETDFEKQAVKGFTQENIKVEMFEGTFYDCRGGWTRQDAYYPDGYSEKDTSIIIKLSEKEQEKENE